MPSRDLVHRISLLVSTAAGAAVTTQTQNVAGANSLDTSGWESVTVILRAHTVTAGTVRVYAQDSLDGTTWGATGSADPPTNILTTAQVIGGAWPAALSAAGTLMVGLADCRRFVRGIINEVGYSGIASCDILLSHPRHSGAAV